MGGSGDSALAGVIHGVVQGLGVLGGLTVTAVFIMSLPAMPSSRDIISKAFRDEEPNF